MTGFANLFSLMKLTRRIGECFIANDTYGGDSRMFSIAGISRYTVFSTVDCFIGGILRASDCFSRECQSFYLR